LPFPAWEARLTSWVNLYEKKLLWLSYSLLKDVHAAQDCVQDAFITSGTKAEGISDEEILKWLTRVTLNNSKSYLRRRKRYEHVLGLLSQQVISESQVVITDPVGLTESIMDLPYKYKVPVILHYHYDFPVHEVAKVLGITTNACKVRLHRAREQLSNVIGGTATGGYK